MALVFQTMLVIVILKAVVIACYCLGVNGGCSILINACYPWFLAVILQVALCMYKRKIRIRGDLFSQIFSMPPHSVDSLFVFCIHQFCNLCLGYTQPLTTQTGFLYTQQKGMNINVILMNLDQDGCPSSSSSESIDI